ncbi:hypothetical protein U8M15_29035, partial [Klebsiella pneumoniae]|uniref:hypothetical protein n=1 Tax=Klebsiella pneumoniae TaxID=573 RepID=UPI002ADFBD67
LVRGGVAGVALARNGRMLGQPSERTSFRTISVNLSKGNSSDRITLRSPAQAINEPARSSRENTVAIDLRVLT